MATLGRRGSLAVASLATALALVAIVLRWRGSDLPAHFFRVGLVERDGFKVWNNFWFGGHHTLGYGVLFPVLGAAAGIWTVAVASAATSAYLVDRLLLATTGERRPLASLAFAAGTVTNVAIGRLPFALGLTIGVAALLALARDRPVLAALASAATSTASPVVSVFLAIVYAALAATSSGRRRRTATALGAAAVVPVVVVALLYPQGGTFPFRWTALVWVLVACAAVAAVVPAERRLVRATAGAYAMASIAAFLLPTPLGANITRLGMYAALPVVLAVGDPARARAIVALAPLLLWWQWSPALDAVLRAGSDPSTEAAYYQPLLDQLRARGAGVERIEIIPTRRHWEAAFVALEVPIARGWERQLDMRFHPQFYESGLTAEAFHRFLLDGGVGLVALPDARLDDSGVEEAALVDAGLAYLRPVWTGEHWRLWEVVDATGLVDGAAEVLAIESDRVLLRVLAPGDVVLRLRASALWAAEPPACIVEDPDGWILLRDLAPGELVVYLGDPATPHPCPP